MSDSPKVWKIFEGTHCPVCGKIVTELVDKDGMKSCLSCYYKDNLFIELIKDEEG